MDDIKRYGPDYMGMERHEYGAYVSYDDYINKINKLTKKMEMYKDFTERVANLDPYTLVKVTSEAQRAAINANKVDV